MYSPWYWHNKALREHPEYQMLGLMDCLREEMMMNMPIAPKTEQVYQQSEQPQWTKKQWGIINQLRGMVRFLYSKETERRANASKRRPIDNNKLINIYKGIEGSNQDSS